MKLYIKTTQTIQIIEEETFPTLPIRPDKAVVWWLARGIQNGNQDPGLCSAFTDAITPIDDYAVQFPLPPFPPARGISAFSGPNLIPMRLLNSTVRGQVGMKLVSNEGDDNNINQTFWYSGKSDQPGPKLNPSILLERANGQSFAFPATSSFLTSSGLHTAPNYLLSEDQVIFDPLTNAFLLTKDWQLLAPNGLSGPVNVNVMHPVLTSTYPPVTNRPTSFTQIQTYAKLTSISEIEITDRALDSGGGITTPVGIGFSVPFVKIIANLTDDSEMKFNRDVSSQGFALLIRLNDLVSERRAFGTLNPIWNPSDPNVMDSQLQAIFQVSTSPLLF